MRINISEVNWERLKSHSTTGGIGFSQEPSNLGEDWPRLPYSIEISDEVADRLVKTYEDTTDCTFDEPVWQYDEAIRCLLDKREAGKLN